MEKNELVRMIDIAYNGTVATKQILEGYIGKPRLSWLLTDLDSKDLLEKYTNDCNKYGMWRLKRQVSDSKSETLAGWKACRDAANNILKAQPANDRAMELLKAAIVYNRLSTMISTVKAELKKPAAVTSTSEEAGIEENQPIVEKSATVRDNKAIARQVIQSALADDKADKAWLRECLEFVEELIA